MQTSQFRIDREIFNYSLAIFISILLCNSAKAIGGGGGIGLPVVLGISPMTFLTFSNLTVGESYQMQRTFAWYWTNLPTSFMATNPTYSQMVTGAVQGADYRLAQNPVPTQAFAIAQMDNGSVVGATITDGGSGYVSAPTVLFVRGGGTNATAITEISSSGFVTDIIITGSGTGYTNTPTIQIAQPPAIAVSPWTQPIMRLKVPDNAVGIWRLQFTTGIGEGWQNYGVVTNTRPDVFVTNNVGFFRLFYP